MSAEVSFPLAGVPLSDAEIVVALDEMSCPGAVVVLVTEQGDRRVGRSVCFVRGTDDVLGVLDRLGCPPAGITLHALHAGELVSSSAPPVRDRGAVTVRSLLWSLVGVAGVLGVYTVLVSSFWAAVASAFGGA